MLLFLLTPIAVCEVTLCICYQQFHSAAPSGSIKSSRDHQNFHRRTHQSAFCNRCWYSRAFAKCACINNKQFQILPNSLQSYGDLQRNFMVILQGSLVPQCSLFDKFMSRIDELFSIPWKKELQRATIETSNYLQPTKRFSSERVCSFF